MGPSNGHQLVMLITATLAAASMDSAAAQQFSPPGGPGPNYFDPKNISPNMAIVMVVLVMAFFLLGFFSIYLRCCAGPPLGDPDEYPSHHRRHGVGGITYASRSSRRARGLDRAVLESFPTMAYADVKEHKVGKGGALECAVCLSEFDDDEMLRLLPKCAHAFHVDCIDAWLASHVTCPVCRANLAGPNYEAPVSPMAPASVVSVTEHVVPVAPQQQAPDTAMASEQAVVVVVEAEETEEERIRREEAAELMRIGSVKRALRSKSSRRPVAFRRSHTTGHSLAAAPAPAKVDETEERYTLRLPEHVLREVVAAGNLRRSASVQTTGGAGDRSARRGFAGGRGGRSVRLGSSSGRWPNMSMLARTFSARLPAWGSMRRGEGDAPAKGEKVAGDGRCDGGACPLGAHV